MYLACSYLVGRRPVKLTIDFISEHQGFVELSLLGPLSCKNPNLKDVTSKSGEVSKISTRIECVTSMKKTRATFIAIIEYEAQFILVRVISVAAIFVRENSINFYFIL